MVYDWTITSGSGGAAKQIQNMLIKKYETDIKVDGMLGRDTVSALNEIADIRREYYTNLTIKDPSQIVYLKGWLNRVDDCLRVNI
jgi:lysozyme family protein